MSSSYNVFEGVGLAVVIAACVLYLILNIVGTIYYRRLIQKNPSELQQNGALASVLIGWFCSPIVNITSPILYYQSK